MEDLQLQNHCWLCLQKCTENAMEDIAFTRFKEIINFVFTFTVMCTTTNSEAKVCRCCYSSVMEFYDYARNVKENQQSIMSVATAVKEEDTIEEACPIKVESLQNIPDSMSQSLEELNTIKIELIEIPYDNDHDDPDASGEDMIASETNNSYDSVDSEKSIPMKKPERSSEKKHKHPCSEQNAFTCIPCSESFSNKHLLSIHMKSHVHLDCKACGKPFPDKKTLRDHMNTMHNNDRRVVCDKCGKTFLKNNLAYHIKASHCIEPVVPLQCKICLKHFNNPWTLRSHKRSIHDEAGQTFTCDICQRTYLTSRSLNVHKRRVHVQEKFYCEICQKQFKRRISLKEHMAAHTGVTLYSCDVCGLSFNSNANMYSHRKRKHPVEWKAKQKVIQHRSEDSIPT